MDSKTYPPIYLESMKYAEKDGEMGFWRESRSLDGECARQIDSILGNEDEYDAKPLDTLIDEIDVLLDLYGNERVSFVLAETVDTLKNNPRISDDNKLWSTKQDYPHYHSVLDTSELILQKRTNPALLNDFLNIFRARTEERSENMVVPGKISASPEIKERQAFYSSRDVYEKVLQLELVRIKEQGSFIGFHPVDRVDHEQSPYCFHVEIYEAGGRIQPYYFACDSLDSLKNAISFVVSNTRFYDATAFVKGRAHVTFWSQQGIDTDFDRYYHDYYHFSSDVRNTYPELLDRTFSDDEMKKLYQTVVDKKEYPDFEGWLTDMCRSGAAYPCHKNYTTPSRENAGKKEYNNKQEENTPKKRKGR